MGVGGQARDDMLGQVVQLVGPLIGRAASTQDAMTSRPILRTSRGYCRPFGATVCSFNSSLSAPGASSRGPGSTV